MGSNFAKLELLRTLRVILRAVMFFYAKTIGTLKLLIPKESYLSISYNIQSIYKNIVRTLIHQSFDSIWCTVLRYCSSLCFILDSKLNSF